MQPRVCIISVGRTSKVISDELKTLRLPAEFVFHEMLLYESTKLPKSLDRFDVFLSSGNNAQILKEKTDKPVITISPSTYDVLLACNKAMEFCESPVVIAFKNDFSTQQLDQISTILSLNITVEYYDKIDNRIEGTILRYKNAGQKCMIGSGLVCDYAEKHGMRSIYLFPRESIRTSLQTAADLAASICQKNSQNLQLSSMISNSRQGILFTDNQQTIFLCNPVAQEYLQAGESEIIGQKISQFFPREIVQSMLSTMETRSVFCKIKSMQFVVEIIPVISKNEITNWLLYLDDVNSIQKTERYIRREVWAQKGFVAKYTFDMYHSLNPHCSEILSTAKSFSQNDESIVILGETGTGKEVLAQSIHNYSKRSGKAFVAVNCAAIPENLLESELFGYSEGAFTGARKGGKEGYFEMAHMGTIFLDEISEMSPALQSKLLRVIQEKQVLRVGGTKLIPFDARIIVATNRNLWELAQKDEFRKDLYYRLNVLELEIPPLRERAEDILPLFERFLKELSPAVWELLSPHCAELGELLSSYSWPGNVRELENFAHMLAASWQPDDLAQKKLRLITNTLNKKRQRAGIPSITAGEGNMRLTSIRTAAQNNEAEQIKAALIACDGKYIKAAQMLGIHRITLWRKLKKLDAEIK